MEMTYQDGIPKMTKNQVWWHVYEGEIRRSKIPLWQHAYNLKSRFMFRMLGELPKVWYQGEVLNKKVAEFHGFNTVTTLGKQIMLDRLYALGTPPAAIADMGVGTDSTASAITDTKLNPSVAGSVLFQAFDALPTRSSLTVTSQSTFGTGVANFTWAETGQANSTTNDGTHLFNRIAPIGPFTKTSAVSIIVIQAVTAN